MKILLTIVLLLIGATAFSQFVTPRTNNSDSSYEFYVRNSPSNQVGNSRAVAKFKDSTIAIFDFFNFRFPQMALRSDGSPFRTLGIDASGNLLASASSGGSGGIMASDTAAMLAGYTRRQELKDTAAAIRTAIPSVSGKLNTSDTAGMLSTYARRQELADTASAIRSSIPSVSTKLNISDTSTMLSPYLQSATAGSLYQTKFASQSANLVYASPNGSSGIPSFRSLVAADIPTLNQNTTGTASNITASSNSTITTLSSLSLPGSQVTGNISGNSANVTGVVDIVNGGTGQTTASSAINALLPTQTGNSGKILQTNGTACSWATYSPGPTGYSTVKRTADTTYSTATLVNLGGMNFSVTAGTLYHYKFVILYQTGATTTGIKVGLTFPATTVQSAQVNIFGQTGDGTGSSFKGTINSSGDNVTSTAVAVANANYVVLIEGTILPSANGTLQLQWASETAAAATIKQGSIGIISSL